MSDAAQHPTPEELQAVDAAQRQALDVAAAMIEAGIPVFAAPPCPAANGGTCSRPRHDGKEEYDLPPQWQKTVPSKVWLEKWRPGWALGAVGGHAADFLDEDPRSGGDASIAELAGQGHMPRVYGVAETPSGGRHYVIAPLGEREANGFMPGLDYQGGAADGAGRAFVWIAPTVKRSKSIDHMGERRPYVWAQSPDLEWLTEGGDESGAMVVSRLVAARARKNEPRSDDRQPRTFTEEEAKRFVQPHLDRLMAAQIGKIEDAANTAAAVLSRFVPGVWDADFAYNVLMAALSETAYDPDRPGAGWAADKFRDVISGVNGRAPDGWRAELKVKAGDPPPPAPADAVEALLAEMKKPAELIDLPPQPYLIKGLLNLNSEAWLIGEPGSRKSFVALDMAGHVARGMPWQGLKVRQGRVVLIVAEGAGGIGARLKAWEMQHGPLGDAVDILPRPVQASNATAWAVLVEACRRISPALVVLDTQARVTVGLEENSATDMGIFVNAVSALRAASGGCVLAIHHTGRNGKDARGSSALDGAQDTELKVIASDKPLRGELRTEKQKDLAESAPLMLSFVVHTVGVDEDGEKVTSLAVAGQDAWLDVETEPENGDPDEGYRIGDPGDWSAKITRSPNSRNQRLVLQYLLEVAGEQGRTESKIKAAVEARRGKFRDEQEWGRVWVAGVLSLTIPEGLEFAGEPVVSRVAGERFGLHQSLL